MIFITIIIILIILIFLLLFLLLVLLLLFVLLLGNVKFHINFMQCEVTYQFRIISIHFNSFQFISTC